MPLPPNSSHARRPGKGSPHERSHNAGRCFQRLALASLTVMGGLLVAACGGGGSDDPPASPSATPPLAAATALVDGTSQGTGHWPTGDSADGGQGQAVAGLSCGSPEETYHVHTHLSIFLNGEQLMVPGLIGIVGEGQADECVYNIHTHDETGKLHVEAPAAARFTLGQMFAIWGQPLSRSNVAGLTGLPVVVYLRDGTTVTEFTGDLADIELTSHREIVIQVGSAIAQIPNFTWNGN